MLLLIVVPKIQVILKLLDLSLMSAANNLNFSLLLVSFPTRPGPPRCFPLGSPPGQYGDRKAEEELLDVLEERRRSADLRFALRTFSAHPYRDAVCCSAAELNQAVLESQHLRYVATEVRPKRPPRVLLSTATQSTPYISAVPSSDRSGDGPVGGRGEGGRPQHPGGNVPEPAAELHPADGLRARQGLQEALQRRLCQRGGPQHGESRNHAMLIQTEELAVISSSRHLTCINNDQVSIYHLKAE